ncbi:MAG: hypothetical protein KDK70_16950 [Myxococcales bacterium]|nr:hypothetical protein [Myxococcales bacterium]
MNRSLHSSRPCTVRGCSVLGLVLAVGLAGCQEPATGSDASGSSGTESTEGSDQGPTVGVDDDTSGTSTGLDPDTTTGSTTETDSTTGDTACEDTPEVCAAAAEAATAAALEAVRDDPDALRDFLVAMPLGGDLHHHLSGGVYAETYLGWAEQDGGFCIQTSDTSLSTSCGDGNDVPIPTGREDLYLDVVRAWSMFEFDPSGGQSAADHFFATFGKFGAISGTQHGRMLADVRRRAATENVLYIEPMLTSNSTARSLGEGLWASMGGGAMAVDDYAPLHAALLAAPGFAAARAKLVDEVGDSEQEAQLALGCATGQPELGCNVVARYQAYISRSGSDSGIFGQMVAAYEAAMVEPRLVALNLVGPEDGSAAMANYDRLMDMLAYLNADYAGISPLRLSLHAGEITASSVPAGYQLDQTQHIRKAVEIAGARRIGHGVDVLSEGDSAGLLALLRDQGVLVEICLASNDIILEVSGAAHPLHDYLAQGVPVALATDDQGVARSSHAAEFFRGVVDQDLDYYELKSMVRASLEYSFLPGQSLWSDYALHAVAAECAPAPGDTPVTQPPSPACGTFLSENPRASVQRQLEAQLEAFESMY